MVSLGGETPDYTETTEFALVGFNRFDYDGDFYFGADNALFFNANNKTDDGMTEAPSDVTLKIYDKNGNEVELYTNSTAYQDEAVGYIKAYAVAEAGADVQVGDTFTAVLTYTLRSGTYGQSWTYTWAELSGN